MFKNVSAAATDYDLLAALNYRKYLKEKHQETLFIFLGFTLSGSVNFQIIS